MTLPVLPDDQAADPLAEAASPAPAANHCAAVCLRPLVAPERPSRRWAFGILALVLTVIYFLMLHGFWAPASPLIDQNAYEMGGKQFARSLTTGMRPANDFVYVSSMYVRAADGTYYPKYPLGMSILYACALWLGQWTGVRHGGTEWAFLVAPLSAAAATLGLYFFLRRIAGGFASLLGALLLSFSPLALVLVNQHWSHHPAMAMAVWGMFFLLAWWQQNGWWRGLIAGFLLGFAVLVRYTEGLLLLPLLFVVLNKLPYRAAAEVRWALLALWGAIAAAVIVAVVSLPPDHRVYIWGVAVAAAVVFIAAAAGLQRVWRERIAVRSTVTVIATLLLIACSVVGSPAFTVPHADTMAGAIVVKLCIAALVVLLFTIRWTAWRILVQISWPIVGWGVPVLYLVLFNKTQMGSWTGYDTTNESVGFTWQQLADNWEYILKQLNGPVIFFYLPIAVLGLGMLFRRNWRLGMLMTLWLVPNLITYGCYYWGVNLPAMIVSALFYFRFYLTCLPPLAACAALLIDDLLRRDRAEVLDAPPRRIAYTVRRVAVVALVGIAVGVGVHLFAPQIHPEIAALSAVLAALVVAASFEAGRGVSGPIAAGAVVALATGTSLFDNRGSLDRDFAINANLFDLGRNVIDRVPAADLKRSPVLFTEDFGPINHLQFAGNFECYTRDAFSPRMGRGPRRSDPNAPDPEQNARLQYTAAVYQNKSDADLVKLQNDIMANALKDGRRVFVVLSPRGVTDFERRYVTPGRFKMKAMGSWKEPVEMSPEGRKAFVSLGLAGTLMMGHSTQLEWSMAEVVSK